MAKSALFLDGEDLCGGDKTSISVIWGNITGANFTNQVRKSLDFVWHSPHKQYIAQFEHLFNEGKPLEGQLELVHGGQVCKSIAIPTTQDRFEIEGEGHE